jgi:hypothetical protein
VYSLQPHAKVDSKNGDFLILVPKPKCGFGGAFDFIAIDLPLKFEICFISF